MPSDPNEKYSVFDFGIDCGALAFVGLLRLGVMALQLLFAASAVLIPVGVLIVLFSGCTADGAVIDPTPVEHRQ